MGIFGQIKTILGGGKRVSDVRARFEILREAISGTMSKFYKARERETGNIVGLKILDLKKYEFFESRFKGLNKPPEGDILAQLQNENIVKLLEHGQTPQGEPYLVMEFIDGPGLNSLIIGKNQLLNGRRVTIIRQAALALNAVHEGGYIHRDICPRNYMALPDFSLIKLIDFGLTVPATPPFMKPGNRTGTPNYMAPELVRRQPTDQRLDVFAFGVMAYELCGFDLPWERGADGQVAMTHSRPPIDIRRRRPKIEPRLADAIMKCVQPNVGDRMKSMRDFIRAIEGINKEDSG